MKLKTAFLIAVAATLALVGCSSSEPTAETAAAGAAPKSDFKVALLTPSPISDAGWSAMAYEGLKEIEKELGATVNTQEATGTKINDAMRSYAQEGYQLVIGHGFEYNEPGAALAEQFPKTTFVSSSGGKTAANAGAFRFYLEQGFYLAGMAAAKISKSGQLAMVGLSVPSINSTFKAFEAGAKAARPDIKVSTVTLTSGSDVAAAKLATLQAIRAGADIIIHQANAAAQGVFDACAQEGASAIGANSDQNANASNAVIASAVIIAKPAFVALAKKVKDGQYKGEVTLIGMQDGAIDFIINPKAADKFSADLVKEIEAKKEEIKSGKFVVPKDEF